jgi:hypothetical protein
MYILSDAGAGRVEQGTGIQAGDAVSDRKITKFCGFFLTINKGITRQTGYGI